MIFEGPRDYLRKNALSLVSIKPNKEREKENSFEKNDFIIKEKLLSDYPMPISLKQNGKLTIHCEECNICIEHFDHHCKFATKCIGRGNKGMFKLWLYSIGIFFVIIFLYLIF